MVGQEIARATEFEQSAVAAEKIIVAAFKVLLPGTATRAEGISDIADLALRGQRNSRNRKSLLHRLEESVDFLAERLSQFEATEIPNLKPADKALAIEGILVAMSAAQLTPAAVIKDHLNPDRIARTMRPTARQYWQKALLPESATEYGEHYLSLASRYIVALVRELPEFTNELLMQTFTTAEKIHELLQRGIATVVIPRFRNGVPSEISAFEADYLSDIIQTYKDMELFGLTGLPPEFCRQPLDIAYITLQSSIFHDLASIADPKGQVQPIAGTPQVGAMPNIRRVDGAFEAVLNSNMTPDRRGAVANPNKAMRIILTGPAGSGKTTVAHWLAIRAAQHRFPDSLRALNDCTPFIIPLRHIFQGNKRYFPAERDLIACSSQRDGEVPGDWVRSRLSGNALVILDGLDELSELHKSDFRAWLSKFEEDYPLAHLTVTSRPEGLDHGWFSEHNFVRLELQPMELDDVRRCINAWFRAVIATDSRREADYRKKMKRLLGDIQQRVSVRDLAETPLLCAMLCAFYAHNLSAAAPQTRGELYERVINTLVHTREVERSSERGPLVGLPLRAKLNLLQALARHLTEDSRATIQCTSDHRNLADVSGRRPHELSARDVLAERLREMTPVPATVEELLSFILDRSVVFRRIASNEAQFVHRSLQEYLAACDYADSGLVDELVERSDRSDWRQILAFAAGKLEKSMVSRLVSKLLDKAEVPGEDGRTLLLLAAQCYGSAGRLDPQVADRTRRDLTAVLPPRDLDEAELVSYGGEEILPWLARREEWPVPTAICCMRSAAIIGGADAVNTLAAYATPMRVEREIVLELLHDWQYFDSSEYALDILADVPLRDCVVVLDSLPLLRAASLIDGLHSIRVTVPDVIPSFHSWAHLRELEEIDWLGNTAMASLEGIGDLKRLRKLNISGATQLRDISAIGESHSLRELYMSDCREVNDLSALAELSDLKVLVLDDCRSVKDFSPIASLCNLMTLSINGCIIENLDICSQLNGLRTLRARVHKGLTDTSGISMCGELRRLDLRLDLRTAGSSNFTPVEKLEDLALSGTVSFGDVTSVGQCSRLRRLSLNSVSWLENLSLLGNLHELRHLSIVNCGQLREANDIFEAINIRYLDLSGCDISDTYFARDMRRLERVYLTRCRSLSDLLGLANLPSLSYINVAGSSVRANVDELRRQSVNGGRLVIVQDMSSPPLEGDAGSQ
jgi:Leucine-rich repeat (LRR) protein